MTIANYARLEGKAKEEADKILGKTPEAPKEVEETKPKKEKKNGI